MALGTGTCGFACGGERGGRGDGESGCVRLLQGHRHRDVCGVL